MEAEERDDFNEFRGQKKSHRRRCSQDTKHKNTNSPQVELKSAGQHQHGIATQVLKPRISKLEHLEAKMASIEVSLSNGMEQGCKSGSVPTRTKSGTATRVEQRATGTESTEKGQEVTHRNLNVANERLRKFADEIQKLRDRLCERDAIIAALREQTNQLLGLTNQRNNAMSSGGQNIANVCSEDKSPTVSADKLSKEMQAKECRLKQLQELIDNKICSVKDIRLKLDSLEVNDLDSRIHQAELECLLEREEMNILNLQQEQVNTTTTLRDVYPPVDENHFHQQVETMDAVTVYSIVSCSQCTSLLAVDIPYDVQAPCFYVTAHHSGNGLFVQWAKDTTKIKKGDRLLEVNGRIVAGCTKDQFLNLLWHSSNNGNLLKVVILRNTPMLPIRRGNKEVDSLKEEMSSVVNKLDTKIKENKELHLALLKLQKDNEQYREECQRLNHRALFLEDQVAELFQRKNGDTGLTRTPSKMKPCGDRFVSVLPSSPTINSSVVKSLSVSHLDSIHVQTTVDHHVLQVQLPFVSNERSAAHGPSMQMSSTSKEAVRTNNVYTNVPFPVIVNKGASDGRINDQESQMCLRGRRCRGSADSDSGNYSGDSMDDAFTIPRTETAHDVKRRLGSVDNFDHGYVNLIESHHMREAVTLGTVLTSKSVLDRKRNGSWPSTTECSTACFRTKQIPSSRSQTLASSEGQSGSAIVQLKVNQRDDDEEWC